MKILALQRPYSRTLFAAILFAAALLFTLTACSGGAATDTAPAPAEPAAQPASPTAAPPQSSGSADGSPAFPTPDPTAAATAAPSPTATPRPTPTPEPAAAAPTAPAEPTPTAVPQPAPTVVPEPAPTAVPASPPADQAASDAFAPLGDNLKWAAQFDNATKSWSVYDPTGTFSVDDLLVPGVRKPDPDSIGELTIISKGSIYSVSVQSEATAILGGKSRSFSAGVNTLVW